MHKIPIKSSVRVDTRRAQFLDVELASEIRRVCGACPELAACYVLDFHKPDADETGVFIALTVDDETHQMEAVARRFIGMLERFPEQAGKIFVLSSRNFVSRYAGTEFYARQAQPPRSASVQPPVDLNKPVENLALSAALTDYIGNRCPQTEQALVCQLQTAVFLVPMLADQMQVTPGDEPGSSTIEKDSLVKIFACTDRDGANHLPLFTDWSAIRGWTEQPVSTLVMPAQDAWQFVLSQPHYAGAFVNPGSQRLQLNRDFIQHLRDASS
jgi:hypothetical protein